MADPIFDLLLPYFDSLDSPPSISQKITTLYINRLTSLSLEELTTTESQSLSQSSQSLLRAIQVLAKRSHKSITASASSLSHLSAELPSLTAQSRTLNDAFPAVESRAAAFAEKYRKSGEANNPVLIARRNALLLAHNVDRLSNVLDLPALLSSAVSSGPPTSTSGTSNTSSSTVTSTSTTSSVNYGSALDLHAHVRRLAALYPESALVASISAQSEREMRLLTSNLIASLRAPGIKLAAAMRTIGWLRRVAPELDEQFTVQQQRKGSTLHQISRAGSTLSSNRGAGAGSSDGALGALLLVCRLASLNNTLEALEPLRELAEQETTQRIQFQNQPPDTAKPKGRRRESNTTQSKAPNGQQTERYLKRYIEVFREQSFAIVSMYKSIFPAALPQPSSSSSDPNSTSSPIADPSSIASTETNDLLPLPSPLATFTARLVDALFETLRTFLPNVTDRPSRDSLMTQVLYCAGSLGRLGGDFSLMLALLEEGLAADGVSEPEKAGEDGEDDAGVEQWVRVVKKHRVQASRLELLASGVGTSKSIPREALGAGLS
jgi:conserved oligomeric Golgi complex subunit 8